jgi:signal peptidase I
VKKPLDLAIADQVEALAIAVAMALVLKFFLVEAYEIPSGSMQPTILGDPQTGIHDRVLADKLTTMLRPPRRWEVMIFRFPNDERALYVKRLVGLPGEKLEILGGDLWADGKIARKPDPVLDSVLKDVFRRPDGGLDLVSAFDAGPGVTLSGPRANFAPDATGELVLRNSVRDDFLHGYDPSWGMTAHDGDPNTYAVADLEVSFDLMLATRDSGFRVEIDSDEGLAVFGSGRDSMGNLLEARFHPTAPEQDAVTGDVRAGDPFSAWPPVGESIRVVARHVDHELVLFLDGDEFLRVPDDTYSPRADRPRTAKVRIALQGGGSVSDVRIRRDIFYTQPRTGPSSWNIEKGHYMALGDNTQGSLDGRGWALKTLVFRPGTVRAGDGSPVTSWTGFDFPGMQSDANPKRLPGGLFRFADIHGDTVLYREADIVSESRTPVPLIPEKHILGKAVAVFWPVFKPFRWKLIR